MKVALSHWQGRIAPVFDVADNVSIVEVKNNRGVRHKDITLREHEPLLRAKEVSMLGVEVLICGAVSVIMDMALTAAGVQVVGFLCGSTKNVLDAFVAGRLQEAVAKKEFVMPGCGGGRRRFRHRHRG